MNTNDKIARLEEFRRLLLAWKERHDANDRSQINQTKAWVRREVIEAGCFKTLTISPPPAVGGLIMRNVDSFTMIFDPPYLMSMIPIITDMIDETIGRLKAGPEERPEVQPQLQVDVDVRKGYAFIAMPIVVGDPQWDDVLDAIKEAANVAVYMPSDSMSRNRTNASQIESLNRSERPST